MSSNENRVTWFSALLGVVLIAGLGGCILNNDTPQGSPAARGVGTAAIQVCPGDPTDEGDGRISVPIIISCDGSVGGRSISDRDSDGDDDDDGDDGDDGHGGDGDDGDTDSSSDSDSDTDSDDSGGGVPCELPPLNAFRFDVLFRPTDLTPVQPDPDTPMDPNTVFTDRGNFTQNTSDWIDFAGTFVSPNRVRISANTGLPEFTPNDGDVLAVIYFDVVPGATETVLETVGFVDDLAGVPHCPNTISLP